MNLPQPTNFSYSSLVNEIEKGEIKIPQFQREFVWDLKMSANLIDSIVKGYPIGTFIFWKTKDRLRSIRNLGNLVLPEPHEGDSINYVLDGQQRLTSLFIAIKGLSISRIENKSEDFSEMYIDLSASDENQIVKTKYEILEINKNFIKVTDLLKGDFTLLASYPQEYHTKINSYKKNFESYNFSVILVKEVPIDIATEIFTRINIGGKSLTLFEIMVAKTYDSVRDFDLSEKYNSLIKELENVKYETISEATVLQTISILLIKDCTRKNILRLEKAKIIDIWETAIDSIKSTVDYFKSYYRIPVSRLLPYNALIIPFSYFFFKHKDKPLGFQQKYLEDFFWRCSISGRYSSAVESKLAQDILKIDSILEEKIPEYEWSVNPTPDFILNNGYFSTGRSFIKAILSIYSYHQPKSFVDNSIVNIDNAYLKIASSKNYHHFFPKAFLTKLKKFDWSEINNVLNITIVDDYLNKREIKDKAPSIYLKKFQNNMGLKKTLLSHLIDIDKSGALKDDFKEFLTHRAKLVSSELLKRIVLTENEKKVEVTLEYDQSDDGDLEGVVDEIV